MVSNIQLNQMSNVKLFLDNLSFERIFPSFTNNFTTNSRNLQSADSH